MLPKEPVAQESKAELQSSCAWPVVGRIATRCGTLEWWTTKANLESLRSHYADYAKEYNAYVMSALSNPLLGIAVLTLRKRHPTLRVKVRFRRCS